jgi:hypothetical protein
VTLADKPAPTVAFTPGVVFTSARLATLTGTVSDDVSEVTGVEIFNDGVDIGAATLNGDGTWTLAHVALPQGMQNLTAIATNALGGTSPETPPTFTLETGIAGPYSSQEQDFDAAGNLIAEYFTKKNGQVYLADLVYNLPDGDHKVEYYEGTFFTKLPFYYKSDLLTADYEMKVQTLYNNDGTHTVAAYRGGQTLNSVGDDTMTAGGNPNETFVFARHPGQEVVTDFKVAGAGHDILSLPKSVFANLAQVLQHTTMQDGNAVIHMSATDTITLENVTKAELKAHPQDFKFPG